MGVMTAIYLIHLTCQFKGCICNFVILQVAKNKFYLLLILLKS